MTNLLGFYDEITGRCRKSSGYCVIILLDLSKAFKSVSLKILLEKLMKYRLDEHTVKCTENWLHGWAQRVAISSTKSSQSRH